MYGYIVAQALAIPVETRVENASTQLTDISRTNTTVWDIFYLKYKNSVQRNSKAMSSFRENKNLQISSTNSILHRQKSWVYEPERLISGSVSYLVKYIGNIPVEQAEGYELVKEACKNIQIANKNKKPVNVRIIISSAEIVLQSKRSDLRFSMDDITYSKQYYQKRQENGTEIIKIFAFIGRSSKNGTLSCYLFESNDHAKVVDLTIKQAKELHLATKPAQIEMQEQQDKSDMNEYLSEDESLTSVSSFETTSITTSEEDASMKSSMDMDSLTSDEDTQEVESSYNNSNSNIKAQMHAEQLRKYYIEQSIKNNVYVHDRSKVNAQNGRYEKSFGHHNPRTSSRIPMYSFGPSNPYMVPATSVPYQNIPTATSAPYQNIPSATSAPYQNIPSATSRTSAPYQNIPVSTSNFYHQLNGAMQQNYYTDNHPYISNGEYETARNMVDSHSHDYVNSQNDNYHNVKQNSWQQPTSPFESSSTNRLEQHYSMSNKQRSNMEDYIWSNKQRNNIEDYIQSNMEMSNVEDYIQSNMHSSNSMEDYIQSNIHRSNSMEDYIQSNKQRNNVEGHIQYDKQRSMEDYIQFNKQRNNVEDNIQFNKQRSNMEDYIQSNKQRSNVDDYFQLNKQRSMEDYIQSNKQRNNVENHIQFNKQRSNMEDYIQSNKHRIVMEDYIQANKQRNNMDDYIEANKQMNNMEDYLKSNKAMSEDGSVCIKNIWATWAGFSRPVVSFGYGSYSSLDSQEIFERSY